MKQPIPVLIVAILYLLVGGVGFVHHFPELTAGHGDAVGMEGHGTAGGGCRGGVAAAEELGPLASTSVDRLSRWAQPFPSAQGASDPRGAMYFDRMAAVPACDGALV